MSENPNVIGEIIEGSTTEFAAESRTLHSPPVFGSFVKVTIKGNGSAFAVEPAIVPVVEQKPDDDDPFMNMSGTFNSQYHESVSGESIDKSPGRKARMLARATYGVVYQASTAPANKGSRLRAYWKDEEQLKAEQPQLEEWHLLTEFRAITIGYAPSDGILRQFIPPQPPRVHAFVEPCTDEEVRIITSRLDFLRTLANFSDAPVEEVIAACIRNANRARGGDFDFLVCAGKELASLMKDDYDGLQAIMRRIVL